MSQWVQSAFIIHFLDTIKVFVHPILIIVRREGIAGVIG